MPSKYWMVYLKDEKESKEVSTTTEEVVEDNEKETNEELSRRIKIKSSSGLSNLVDVLLNEDGESEIKLIGVFLGNRVCSYLVKSLLRENPDLYKDSEKLKKLLNIQPEGLEDDSNENESEDESLDEPVAFLQSLISSDDG